MPDHARAPNTLPVRKATIAVSVWRMQSGATLLMLVRLRVAGQHKPKQCSAVPYQHAIPSLRPGHSIELDAHGKLLRLLQ